MEAQSTKAEEIDAVVTWVDGSDPVHRAKREAIMEAVGRSPARQGLIPAGKNPIRFSDNGELRWCLYSIRKFAPWIRHIHLVTDNQVPDFLTPSVRAALGVSIVDHHEIFRDYESVQPTFNPYAIETVLWRIEGLSEKFIFFNDDFVLLQSVNPGDFFRGDDVVLRGAWQRIRGASVAHRVCHSALNSILFRTFGISRTMQLHAQMNGAKHAGYHKQHFRSPHVPHPLRRETFEKHFQDHPNLLKQNLSLPFRGHADFVPVSLANHLEIQYGRPQFIVCRDNSMFSGENASVHTVDAIISHIQSGACFLCLQSLDAFREEARTHIRNNLDQHIFGV